jgi:hypothetical protein
MMTKKTKGKTKAATRPRKKISVAEGRYDGRVKIVEAKTAPPPSPNVQVFENPMTWKMGEPVEVSQPKRPVRGRVAEHPTGEDRPGHLYVLLDRGEKRATGQWFPFELCRRPKP